MQTLPVEEAITVGQEALPYERVSTIVENGQAFMVNECICKKEKGLLATPCDRSLHVCLAIAPVPGAFDDLPFGKVVTKEEAYELLRESEENALVHLTANVQTGHIYICNCCKCCCGVLASITKLGIPASRVVNSHYYAVIDRDDCTDCGVCADERCQVDAIEQDEDGSYRVTRDGCIGCALCISACPTDAIKLVRKGEEQLLIPPKDDDEWFKERGRRRGVDFSNYE
jgi:ferredoxin